MLCVQNVVLWGKHLSICLILDNAVKHYFDQVRNLLLKSQNTFYFKIKGKVQSFYRDSSSSNPSKGRIIKLSTIEVIDIDFKDQIQDLSPLSTVRNTIFFCYICIWLCPLFKSNSSMRFKWVILHPSEPFYLDNGEFIACRSQNLYFFWRRFIPGLWWSLLFYLLCIS